MWRFAISPYPEQVTRDVQFNQMRLRNCRHDGVCLGLEALIYHLLNTEHTSRMIREEKKPEDKVCPRRLHFLCQIV